LFEQLTVIALAILRQQGRGVPRDDAVRRRDHQIARERAQLGRQLLTAD
jgi:hypothetical protein